MTATSFDVSIKPITQSDIDEADRLATDEIIDGTKPEHLLQVAKNWCRTARQEIRDSAFWHEKSDEQAADIKALTKKVDELENRLHLVFDDLFEKEHEVSVLIRTIDMLTERGCDHDE